MSEVDTQFGNISCSSKALQKPWKAAARSNAMMNSNITWETEGHGHPQNKLKRMRIENSAQGIGSSLWTQFIEFNPFCPRPFP